MGLWRDKKRKDWRYAFQHMKKSYAGGGFTTKAEARMAREERRKEVLASTWAPTPRVMGFKEVASIYLDEAERRFVGQTYKYKAYVFRCFLKKVGDVPMHLITPQLVHNYLMTRPTNNNYNAHRKDLSALFTFAKRRLRIIEHNPCETIDKMPHTTRMKVVPSKDQVDSLLKVASPDLEKPLLLVILLTTARVDEILRLRWQDVDFERGKLIRWTRKRRGGSYEPIITHINSDLKDVLSCQWEARIQDNWVFYNLKTKDRYYHRPKLMHSLCKRANIDPPFGFHALRHFMASYLADEVRVSKKTISTLLGHKSLQTTEIYLHSIENSVYHATVSLEGIFNTD